MRADFLQKEASSRQAAMESENSQRRELAEFSQNRALLQHELAESAAGVQALAAERGILQQQLQAASQQAASADATSEAAHARLAENRNDLDHQLTEWKTYAETLAAANQQSTDARLMQEHSGRLQAQQQAEVAAATRATLALEVDEARHSEKQLALEYDVQCQKLRASIEAVTAQEAQVASVMICERDEASREVDSLAAACRQLVSERDEAVGHKRQLIEVNAAQSEQLAQHAHEQVDQREDAAAQGAASLRQQLEEASYNAAQAAAERTALETVFHQQIQLRNGEIESLVAERNLIVNQLNLQQQQQQQQQQQFDQAGVNAQDLTGDLAGQAPSPQSDGSAEEARALAALLQARLKAAEEEKDTMVGHMREHVMQLARENYDLKQALGGRSTAPQGRADQNLLAERPQAPPREGGGWLSFVLSPFLTDSDMREIKAESYVGEKLGPATASA
eukprot:NODE_2971_length_2113_cov_8.256294.p1 GENE.NODE_2971_length_2113_cov_8.256294~~NODE_2971_length_2113_cov_8.256294.p1  ORF type:complete len:453 (-),score=121.09 NODE_2971_length_2113_cov_8.256294:126-1484(-)